MINDIITVKEVYRGIFFVFFVSAFIGVGVWSFLFVKNSKQKDVSQWKSYKSNGMGVKVRYPSEGYVVREIDQDHFVIVKDGMIDEFHVWKLNSPSQFSSIQKYYDQYADSEEIQKLQKEHVNMPEKVFNDIVYIQILPRDGEKFGYGYFTNNKDDIYVFTSDNELMDDVFELMMDTVRFK